MREVTDKAPGQTDTSYTVNRELSWLKFNERVLEEADDLSVPVLERLKFVSIFASNLDEFFMIRVGSLYDLSLVEEDHTDNKSGMTPRRQIAEIMNRVGPLCAQKDRYLKKLEDELCYHDIIRLRFGELDKEEEKLISSRFNSFILPVLSPLIVDSHHPFPHLENKALYVVTKLKAKGDIRFGIIPVPKILPRLLFLPGECIRYILTEDIILEFAQNIFEKLTVMEKSVVSVTRNADINPDDEALDFEEDFRVHMKKILKKRARLAAVRLEIQGESNAGIAEYLCSKLFIGMSNVFTCASPLDMSYVFPLLEKVPAAAKRAATYPQYEPRYPPELKKTGSMTRQAMQRDILLSYPYNSMEPFLQLIREASSDPAVISIKITLYRIDKTSRLAEYLSEAAAMGKEVTVVMELRARFDEQNNIEWAERLEEAGCKLIYGFEGFKVHSKICLITRKEKNRFQYITQIGTGNYNEKTARLYSDLSLITANEEIGLDAAAFFKNISISNADGLYGRLLVAPSGLKRAIIALIDGEIEKAAVGRPSGIVFKLNSLSDRDVIDKLSEASKAGVPVDLIIRGLCCLLPGVPGKTENIRVTSIIGRYLEHARVYSFGADGEAAVYISSADVMTRNTERRIEIACPVDDGAVRSRILDMLKTQLSDNTKAWRLMRDGSYVKIEPAGKAPVNSQTRFEEEAAGNITTGTRGERSLIRRAADGFAAALRPGFSKPSVKRT